MHQGLKIIISWNKHKFEIRMQPKNNKLDYMIDPTLGIIIVVQSFIQNGAIDLSW